MFPATIGIHFMADLPAPPSHALVKERLLAAIELPPGTAEPWLDALAAREPAVAAEVRRLLQAHRDAGSFLEPVSWEMVPEARCSPEAPGRTIGGFQIERELGRGGMGTVYLGTRQGEGFTQRAAIKVVRDTGLDPRAVDRFLAERRILADLNHPAIAHFIDGGTTEAGQPFLAMEYVDGVPIVAYCDAHTLSVRERVQLFLRVCQGVQTAHQRLVIHRDIKPSNILVTADGAPKLLDFGIAKPLGPGASVTVTTALLTPLYASPEQASGHIVTTTSDIYSLGVLLFELLTGSLPYRTASRDSDPLTVLDAIRHEPAERPSVAAARQGRPSVDSDLDAVVSKTLRKEEALRYGSVDQLSRDLSRWLDGHPVEARSGSRAYLARKFVTRYRVPLAAAAVATVSLVTATVVSVRQARVARQQQARAEQRFTDLRRLANAMAFEVNDALASGSTAARAVLVQRASEQLDLLAADAPNDPVLAEEVATAYERLATVLGQGVTANVGRADAARTYQRKAVASRRGAFARTAALDAGLRLVESLVTSASFENEMATSIQPVEEAIRIATDLRARYPHEAEVTRRLLDAEAELAMQYRSAGDHERALSLLLALAPRLAVARTEFPGDERVERISADALQRLGFLLGERKRFSEAIDHLQTAFDLDRKAFERAPQDPGRRRSFSVAHTQLGTVLMQAGQATAARGHFEEALVMRQAALAADPSNELAVRDVAAAHWYVGQLELHERRYEAAVEAHARALATMHTAPTIRPDGFSVDVPLGLAASLQGVGRQREAVEAYREALARARAYRAKDATVPAARQRFAEAGSRLAAMLLGSAAAGQAGAMSEACALAREAREALGPVADLPAVALVGEGRDALDKALAACGGRSTTKPPA